MTQRPPRNLPTRLVQAGRKPGAYEGAVNPPIQRASTILAQDPIDLYKPGVNTYGIHGMAVHDVLKEALCDIEGAAACTLVPSGLAACTLALFALTSPNEHVLVTDSVYGPTRRFCDRELAARGIHVEYFAPTIGADFHTLLRANTSLVVLETPGSLTFEMQDVGLIAGLAKAAGARVMLDNTWSAGLYFPPFGHGVDVSIQALTKYQAGHSDVLAGAVLTADERLGKKLSETAKNWGFALAPEDAYLVLRGLRSLPVRLAQHDANGRKVGAFLAQRDGIRRVRHPALPGDPGHALWKRDFTGAAGVFAFELDDDRADSADRVLSALTLFGLGFSWGGYESLAIPCDPQLDRTLPALTDCGPLIRLSIGLEDADDLIADLDQALATL